MPGKFGKPDPVGRSSGKLAGRERKLRSPPKGQPWVWHTRELLESPAWRALGIHARRLIDFLEVEHASHAGQENGNLRATYTQLAAWGIGRRFIPSAIKEAERLGLIAVEHGGRWNMTNRPSRFRLTYYADADGRPPTDDWKRVTLVDDTQRQDLQKQNRPTERCTTVVHQGCTTSSLDSNPADHKTAENRQSPNWPVVHPWCTPSISWRGPGDGQGTVSEQGDHRPIDQATARREREAATTRLRAVLDDPAYKATVATWNTLALYCAFVIDCSRGASTREADALVIPAGPGP